MHKRQQEMNRESNATLQRGTEGSDYHKLYGYETHKIRRLELSRDIIKHQQQSVTSKE